MNEYNVTYARYHPIINGKEYKIQVHFHDLKRFTETFKNVSWRMVPNERN